MHILCNIRDVLVERLVSFIPKPHCRQQLYKQVPIKVHITERCPPFFFFLKCFITTKASTAPATRAASIPRTIPAM